jgi:hypothetical protein
MPEISVLAHAVTIPADLHDMTVVHEPVDQGSSHDFIVQDIASLLEAFVGGQHG